MTLSRRRLLGSLAAGLAAAPAVRHVLSPHGRGTKHRSVVRPEEEAMLRAVRAGDLAAVRRMLRMDARLAAATDVHGRSAFIIAVLAGRGDIAEALRVQLAELAIPLDVVEAVLAEDWTRMEALLKAEPDLANACHPIGGTPLYAGALVGSNALWRQRSLGCLSDAVPAGGSGWTPARAAMECRTAVGARIAATDVLANGGDANHPQRHGSSVLHAAVVRRDEVLVRLAIRKGASPHARDDRGRTPRELAAWLDWPRGVKLLDGHASLPRDRRASRFAFDQNGKPAVPVDVSDVPRALQQQVTGNSHHSLERVRELVDREPRLTWSRSGDDELAIEAAGHMGNRPIIRYHLDKGAPLSLPTAVALGDGKFCRFLLDGDPDLVHERGAHDFPVMHYVAFGGGDIEMAELLRARGAEVDQESLGVTALHWCVLRDERDCAAWLLEHGADPHAVAYKWRHEGDTPLQIARGRDRAAMAELLVARGAKR